MRAPYFSSLLAKNARLSLFQVERRKLFVIRNHLTHEILFLYLKNSEESKTETEPAETGLTCSCESASQPNLPDVIQNDCKDFEKTKNDSEV